MAPTPVTKKFISYSSSILECLIRNSASLRSSAFNSLVIGQRGKDNSGELCSTRFDAFKTLALNYSVTFVINTIVHR